MRSVHDPRELALDVEHGLADRLRRSVDWPRHLPFELDRALVELYWRVEAQRADRSPYLLQFIAPAPGAGTSTIASGFAVASAMASNRPVLLLALRGRQGHPSILGSLAARDHLQDCIEATPEVPRLLRASLAGNDPGSLTRMPAPDLQAVLDLIRERFDAVIIDGGAISESADGLVLSRHCDASVLVVRAEHSRRPAVRHAIEQIEHHGAEVLGVVLNRTRRHIPRWLDRWFA